MVGGTLPMASMRYPICLADQLHMSQICAYYLILVFDHLCKNSHCLDNCFHSSQVMIVFQISYTYIWYVHLQGFFFSLFYFAQKTPAVAYGVPHFSYNHSYSFPVKIFLYYNARWYIFIKASYWTYTIILHTRFIIFPDNSSCSFQGMKLLFV